MRTFIKDIMISFFNLFFIMILNVGFNTFKSWFLLIATETATSNSFLFGESLQGGQIEIFLLTL